MDTVAVSWILLTTFSLFATVKTQENVIRFQSNEIKEIVDTHNDLRRSIYNAANMRELTWNEAVAFAASEWGTRCEYISRPDNQWGQNMNYFYGRDTNNSSMDLFRDSFRAWSNETRHYDYRRYRYCGSKNVCSYVQLIAADVQEVGCAIVKCPKLQLQAPTDVQQHAKLLICFYTPWVNILGTEVFIPEKRCSACPVGTTCVDNLCSARFYQTGSRTIPIGSTSVKIEPISGTRPSGGSISISGKSETRPSPSQPTFEERHQTTESRHEPEIDRRHGGRHRNRENRNKPKEDRVVGSHNSFGSSKTDDDNRVYQEHRGSPASYAIKTSNETIVVYTPNNRVIPFPGKSERKVIRRIEKFEKKVEKDLDQKQESIMHSLELIANNITVANVSSQQRSSRKKRQASFQDAVYLRRLEYERYLREYENLARERQERRRQYEEELRRREHHNNQVQELRRAQELTRYNDEVARYNNEVERRRQQQLLQDRRRYEALALTQNQDYYEEERRRRRRLEEERRRYEALALLQNEGDLTGEEQFFTISAHNLLRREAGARDLAWSSHLERWAKYVIRCETEYPGPITCYTNFGKAEAGEEIYNVVYQWSAEGSDLNRPLRYGCRTPYDKSLCNHLSNIRTKSLTQMACAAKNCGSQRQLTCIYSDG